MRDFIVASAPCGIDIYGIVIVKNRVAGNLDVPDCAMIYILEIDFNGALYAQCRR